MQGLRTCLYYVNDLTQARDWYAKAFNAAPYFDTAFYVGFNIGGYELGLHPSELPPEKKVAGTITYWGVEEIQKEYDRLIELGAMPHEAPNNVGGDIMVASVLDPWGNVLGIIFNPDFKVT